MCSLPAPDLPIAARARAVRDRDAAALTGLIGSAYAEYPGCVLDLAGVDADLTAPATTIAAKGGEWILVEGPDGEVIACVGWAPTRDDTVELKRLYVRASARGAGVGSRLVRWVERRARDVGATTVELWSDTRFEDAHRLYERLGYRRRPGTRELGDPSDTTEAHFVKDL